MSVDPVELPRFMAYKSGYSDGCYVFPLKEGTAAYAIFKDGIEIAGGVGDYDNIIALDGVSAGDTTPPKT